MARNEIYVSVDIEADGPFPGGHSMLSFGAAAFRRGNTTPLSTFEINLKELPGATPDPDTMAWWQRQDPETWAYIRKSPVDPEIAMRSFAKWAHGLPGKPVLAVFPSWDAMWVSWYFGRYGIRNPFGIGALDIKSMAYSLLKKPFRGTTKRAMPKRWFDGAPPHTHRGLDDAIGQGILLIHILDELDKGER